MIPAAELIADLDQALLDTGITVTLRRPGSPSPTDVTVRAAIRPLRADELVGNVDQTTHKVVLSPTEINADTWPLPVKKGDQIIQGSKVREVHFAGPIYVQDTLVRINLRVT